MKFRVTLLLAIYEITSKTLNPESVSYAKGLIHTNEKSVPDFPAQNSFVPDFLLKKPKLVIPEKAKFLAPRKLSPNNFIQHAEKRINEVVKQAMEKAAEITEWEYDEAPENFLANTIDEINEIVYMKGIKKILEIVENKDEEALALASREENEEDEYLD